MNMLLAGVQGSGKGTQGKKLSEYLKIPHISVGDVIKSHLEKDSNIEDSKSSALGSNPSTPVRTYGQMVRYNTANIGFPVRFWVSA